MQTTDLPTGTVTFVFTDIEGSTQLLKRLGKKYGEVLAEHRKILRAAAREHGGEEVDNQGDSFLFAFPRAEEAAAAAIEGQQALATQNWPMGSSLRVRMGIHTAEPSMSDEGRTSCSSDQITCRRSPTPSPQSPGPRGANSCLSPARPGSGRRPYSVGSATTTGARLGSSGARATPCSPRVRSGRSSTSPRRPAAS